MSVIRTSGPSSLRADLNIIAGMITPGARVLDVGCGDGELLDLLARKRNVDGRGIELSQEGVNACVTRGLSVIQGDADTDLRDYPDDAFDYVILSQTIQATWEPREVLTQMRRIARHSIVSLPNFGHWRVRLQLLLGGRMPVTKELGHSWYDTPNIHLCTLYDFVDLAHEAGFRIDEALSVTGSTSQPIGTVGRRANLFAELAVFSMSRQS